MHFGIKFFLISDRRLLIRPFRNISSSGEDVAAETVGESDRDIESEIDIGLDALQPSSPYLADVPLPLDDEWDPPLGILRGELDINATDNSPGPSTSCATTPNVSQI